MSELMKELTYDGKKVVVEVARRDANGNIINTTYATVNSVNNKLDTSIFNEYIGTTAPSTYVKIKDFKINYLDSNKVAYKTDISIVEGEIETLRNDVTNVTNDLYSKVSANTTSINDVKYQLTNNYYTKSQTYTKDEVNTIIQKVEVGEWQVVSSLPTKGEEGKVYLVGTAQPYDMYIWESEAWLKIGTTQIDLSGYVPTSRTVNGHALTGNVTVTASDVGLGSVINAGQSYIYNAKNANPNIYFTQNGAFTLYTNIQSDFASVNTKISTLTDNVQDLETNKLDYVSGSGAISVSEVAEDGNHKVYQTISCLVSATDVTIG